MPAKLSRAAIFASTVLAGCYTSNPPPQRPPHEERQFADPPPAAGSGRVSGTIRDVDGRTPAAGIPIHLQSASQPSMPLRKTVTDANGRYSFTDVPPGGYYLVWGHPNPDGGGRMQATVELADGEAEQRDLQISPPAPPMPMPYGAPPARRRIV